MFELSGGESPAPDAGAAPEEGVELEEKVGLNF
jgi:hypothetical protein